jgi:hypothetical protein
MKNRGPDERPLVKLYSLDDVGTRGEHMTDLYDVWEFALEILTRAGWHSGKELDQAQEIKVGLKLLMHHMEAGAPSVVAYAQEINNLPKDAKEIPNDKATDPATFTTHRDTL